MDLSNPISAVIPSLEGQVLRVLAHTTASLSGSRIAELAAAGSNPGIRTALARLVRHGTVIARRSGPSILYTANRDHLAWPAIQFAVATTDDLRGTLEERIRNRLADGGILNAHDPLVLVALYGSAARGTGTIDSDVDIVMIFRDTADAHALEQTVDDLSECVERWTGNVCNIYDITETRLAELVKLGDPLIESWAQDARTLLGPDLRRRLLGAS